MAAYRWSSLLGKHCPTRSRAGLPRCERTTATSRPDGPFRPGARLCAPEWLEPRTLLNGGTLLEDVIARDDFYSTPAGQMLVVRAPGVLANDSVAPGHRLEAWNMYGNMRLEHGLLEMDFWTNDGSFRYTPDPGYNGPEVFTYYWPWTRATRRVLPTRPR